MKRNYTTPVTTFDGNGYVAYQLKIQHIFAGHVVRCFTISSLEDMTTPAQRWFVANNINICLVTDYRKVGLERSTLEAMQTLSAFRLQTGVLPGVTPWL